jgi:cobalamin biosynthesis Mg chelatase CobN
MTTTALPPNHDERMETYARNTEEFARRTSSAARFLAWVVGLVALLALIGVIVTGAELAHVANVVNPASSCQSLGGSNPDC